MESDSSFFYLMPAWFILWTSNTNFDFRKSEKFSVCPAKTYFIIIILNKVMKYWNSCWGFTDIWVFWFERLTHTSFPGGNVFNQTEGPIHTGHLAPMNGVSAFSHGRRAHVCHPDPLPAASQTPWVADSCLTRLGSAHRMQPLAQVMIFPNCSHDSVRSHTRDSPYQYVLLQAGSREQQFGSPYAFFPPLLYINVEVIP